MILAFMIAAFLILDCLLPFLDELFVEHAVIFRLLLLALFIYMLAITVGEVNGWC